MKTLKLILLLCIVLCFTRCNTLKFTSNPPFKIISINYDNWVGVQPGVSGIKIDICYQSDDEITFENMYFYNKIVKIESREISEKIYIIGYFNTSIREYDTFLEEDDTPQKKAVKEVRFPFKLKENEAVVSFKENNRTKYYKVVNIPK